MSLFVAMWIVGAVILAVTITGMTQLGWDHYILVLPLGVGGLLAVPFSFFAAAFGVVFVLVRFWALIKTIAAGVEAAWIWVSEQTEGEGS